MKKGHFIRGGAVAGSLVLLAMALLQSLHPAIAVRATTGALAEPDLSSESRALDTFVVELARLDKRTTELGRKTVVTRAEFDPVQNSANDLKRRLSEVQNAIGAIVRKLKAAGQWDNLNATLLAKSNDSSFRSFVRNEDFKKILEEFATTLTTQGSQIDVNLSTLRAKVARFENPAFEPSDSTLAGLVRRVGYNPTPAASGSSFRCRVAGVRFGVAVLVFGATPRANEARQSYQCYCIHSEPDCAAVAAR